MNKQKWKGRADKLRGKEQKKLEIDATKYVKLTNMSAAASSTVVPATANAKP